MFVVSAIANNDFNFKNIGNKYSSDMLGYIKEEPNGKDLTKYVKNRYFNKNPNGNFSVFLKNLEIINKKYGGYLKLPLWGYQENNRLHTLHQPAPPLTCRGLQNGVIKFLRSDGLIKMLSVKQTVLLMGFDKDDYLKIMHKNDNILFNQFGNSVVVNIYEDIFKEILRIL